MLVEREAELAELRGPARDDHERRIVVVTGPPGIGKSALLRSFRAEANARVLSAVGTRVGQGVAHGVLRQLFLPRARDSGEDAAPFDGPGSVLRRLVLRGDAPADTVAIAYAVHWTLSSLARSGRVVVTIDDLQWADPASVTVIAHVSALLTHEPVDFVLGLRETPREAEVDAVSELVSMSTTVLRPRPLSASGIAAMIGVSAAQSERVRELSGGIPFYVAEMAGLLAGGEDLVAPPRVIESVMSRLQRLGAEALAVARAVCVLGPEAGPSAVARLAGVDLERLDGLERLLTAEGILGNESREPVLTVAHPLVADAVLAETAGVRLASLRSAAARILHDNGVPAARVAAQLLLTEPGEQPWRVAVLRAAAVEAASTGAFGSAVALIDRALLERGVAVDERGELYGLLGAAHFGAGDGVRAAASWLSGVDDLGPNARGERMIDVGDALYLAGDYPAAEEAYREGAEQLEHAGIAPGRGAALGTAARHAAARLTLAPLTPVVSAEVLLTVLDRPAASDGREERRFLAIAALSAHTREAWEADPERLAVRAFGGGAFATEGFADDPTTYLLSGALYLVGRFDDALDLLDRAVLDARGRNRLASEVSARGVRGPIRVLAGDLRSGIDDLQISVSRGRLSPWLYHVLPAALLLRSSTVTGDRDAATAAARELEDLDLTPSHRALWLLARAEQARAAGEPEEALRLAAHARSLDPEGGFAWTFSWRGTIAAASLDLGDRERAAALNAEELELLDRRRIPLPARLEAQMLRARVIDSDEAHTRLSSYFEALPQRHRWQRALVAERLAELEIARGDVQAAHEHLMLALTCAQEQAVEPLERRVRTALKSMGREPIPSAMERRKQSLSPAELRVAMRAAAGLSNREIARELFVTPKTVEFHLARIFRKLGVQSRRALVSAFDEPVAE